jgi:hypothetical protein
MGKVIVFTNVTLDEVMQAPARPDEDRRGDFEYGGWGAPYRAMTQAGDSIASWRELCPAKGVYVHDKADGD